MLFLLKTLFNAFILSFMLSLPAYTQWRENKATNTQSAVMPTIIPKDSIRKYWLEMFNDRHFIWAGIGINIASSQTIRFADEANFVPKHKNDLYGLRLRISYSAQQAGLPTAYSREVSALYGKVYKSYRFMATASTGLSFIKGRKWENQIGMVTTPVRQGLRTNAGTYPLYSVKDFWTIGVPIRGQAFFIAGKEIALGITLGTNLNVKQLWGDAMLTLLLGLN